MEGNRTKGAQVYPFRFCRTLARLIIDVKTDGFMPKVNANFVDFIHDMTVDDFDNDELRSLIV